MATAEARVSLPLLRGTAEGADCESCPFSFEGRPNRPVYSEYPEQPKWMLIGEGPGFNETRLGRPFIGLSGEVVNKLLARIGRPRDEIFVGNSTLCMPPQGSPDDQRQRAATACKTRLELELAQFPGVPILTLGAVAARAVIPQAALDAIDPPDVPESKQKRQKRRQRAQKDEQTKRDKRLGKIERRIFKELLDYQRRGILDELRQKYKRKPDKAYLERELDQCRPQLEIRAKADALVELENVEEERAKKPKKKKPIKISDIVSTCFDVDVDGTGMRAVIPAIHPAALLRGGGRSIAGSHTPDLAYVNLTYDFGKIDALAQGKDVRLKLNIEIEGQDAERATRLFVEALQAAFDEGEIAIDLETYVDDADKHTALMAYVAKVRAIGLATKQRSISVLWDLLPSWAFSYFQAALVSERVSCTFHNALYDRTVLKANGFQLREWFFDSLLAHHSAFPGCAHNLQIVTAQFFAIAPWKSEFRLGAEDTDALLRYNAIDTGSTLADRSIIDVYVKRNKNERTYAIDRKMSEVASNMHLAGMPVSREVNSELLTTFSKNVAESREAVEDIARDPELREGIWHHLAMEQAKIRRKKDLDDFEGRYKDRLAKIGDDERKGKWRWKISAGKHVAALLQTVGVQLHQVTPSGAVSTKKDILESLAHIPIVRDLLTFRENDKLLTTFVWQLLDRHIDGQLVQQGYADAADRIHPLWSVHKITGRWASYDPVVSNVPKSKFKRMPDGSKKIIRPNLRRQIVAPRGRKFVGFDLAQLEARIIALLSADPFLCNIFATGGDIHTECARLVFPTFDKLQKDDQKQLREQTKPLEYASFYGANPETCWRGLLKEGFNVKLADTTAAIGKIMGRMSGVVRWQRQQIARASIPPYVISSFLLGRRRTWPMGQVEATEALNFGVQSAGADIMNTGMARMAERLPNYREVDAIVQVHDAAVFECWDDDAEDLKADVIECFTQSHESGGLTIPFPIDARIGDDWSQV